MSSMLRSNVVLLGGFVVAFLVLGRSSEAQPYDIHENDIAIANGVPKLLLSSEINGWELVNDLSFKIKNGGSVQAQFGIDFSAPEQAMFIAESGALGLGTIDPDRVGLHIKKTDERAKVLLQRTQTSEGDVRWGLGVDNTGDLQLSFNGEEATFPLLVEAGTPNYTMVLRNTDGGHLQVGNLDARKVNQTTLAKGKDQHIALSSPFGATRSIMHGNKGCETYMVHTGGVSGRKIMRSRLVSGVYALSSVADDAVTNIDHAFVYNLTTTNVGIKTPNPTKPLQVGDPGANDGNGAHVTPGGVWTNASSRTLKDDIQPLGSQQARDTVRALEPVGYRYKNEPDERYVGFIAEDVPDLVATSDRKSLAAMDVVAVLTKVVQDQDRQLERQQQLIESLSQRLTDLEAKARP